MQVNGEDMATARAGVTLLALLISVSMAGCVKSPSTGFTDEEVAAYAPATPQREVRILTINVWSGLTYKGVFKIGRYQDNPENRYKKLVAELRGLDPDIIAIQEANPLPDYVKRLASDLGYREIHHVSLGGIRMGPVGIPVNLREGEAILVKRPWTLVDLGTGRLAGFGISSNWLCFHFGEITKVILGRVIVNGKPLYVYVVHLHSGPFKGAALDAAVARLSREMPRGRVEQAKEGVDKDVKRREREIKNLLKFVNDTLPPGAPAIIAGDFNTDERSGELNPILAERRWVDSFWYSSPAEEGNTWDPPNNPNFRQECMTTEPYSVLSDYHELHPSRIDFIMINRNISPSRIMQSRVVLTPSEGVPPSDHYGLLTTLKW